MDKVEWKSKMVEGLKLRLEGFMKTAEVHVHTHDTYTCKRIYILIKDAEEGGDKPKQSQSAGQKEHYAHMC